MLATCVTNVTYHPFQAFRANIYNKSNLFKCLKNLKVNLQSCNHSLMGTLNFKWLAWSWKCSTTLLKLGCEVTLSSEFSVFWIFEFRIYAWIRMQIHPTSHSFSLTHCIITACSAVSRHECIMDNGQTDIVWSEQRLALIIIIGHWDPVVVQ